MDCFEARPEFAAFWRGSIEEARRQELLDHLRACAGCDRAFRAFALTAPVLHSDSRPMAVAAEHSLPRPVARTARSPRTWLAAAAMATLAMAATVAVYLAVTPPTETLDEALSPQDSMGEIGPSSPFDLSSQFDLNIAG